jgi:hypothetical protein
MQPSLELRLRAMEKAMAEVVLPSIAADDSAAIEQASLVLGSLRMLRSQVDYVHCYEVLDARAHVQLIQALSDALGEQAAAPLAEAAAAAHASLAIINDPVRPVYEVRQINAKLRALIAETVSALLKHDAAVVRQKVWDVVLVHSSEQILRERAWVAGTHFDMFPDTLRAIPEALGLKDPQ